MKSSYMIGIFISLSILGACGESEQAEIMQADTKGVVLSVTGFDGPEAVRYDAGQDIYFVSNFAGENKGDANGFVSKVSAAGEILELKFMQGSERWPLHGPRGLFINAQGLWVVDADGVHLFDRMSGAQLAFVDLSAFEPGFPNDIVEAGDGAMYVTDTGKSRVYRIVNGVASLATETTMMPNGITINPATGGLLLAPWDNGQALVEWDYQNNSFRSLGNFEGGGNFDGIEVVGDIMISASQQDTSLHFMKNGKDRRVVPLPGRPADIGIDTKRNRVAVPYVSLDRVDIIALDAYL